MTTPGIWTNDDSGWTLSRPKGFPDEATLHRLIAEAPDLLPLAGAPKLVVLGSEVMLGTGYVDLLGFETSGRPVIIEVKLRSNAEARRAVVAQVLAYAAYLQGETPAHLEEGPLRHSLQATGHATILDAVSASDQEGSFQADEFAATLEDSLNEGRFRLVFVLDDVPPELSTLVAYLEGVTTKILIDLVTVSAYEVNGTQVILPQRVTPERHAAVVEQRRTRQSDSGTLYTGSDEFEASIDGAPEENRAELRLLMQWARGLEAAGTARLQTYRGGSGNCTLLPRIQSENAGLITIWNDGGISMWRSVFERKAPDFIEPIEALISPDKVRQGNVVHNPSEEFLSTLAQAYERAADS